jgi:1-acyl-sn-glycerol-3-phosphate acyltransferase
MPRMRDGHFVDWHPLQLTIHQPIYPVGKGDDNINATLNQAYDSIMSALVPEYQGFVENPDQ